LESLANLVDLFNPDAEESPKLDQASNTDVSSDPEQEHCSGEPASDSDNPDQGHSRQVQAWMDPEKAMERQRLLNSQYRRSQRLTKQIEKQREMRSKQSAKLKHCLDTIKRQNIVIRSLEKTIKDILN
jgi:hypothetical protein